MHLVSHSSRYFDSGNSFDLHDYRPSWAKRVTESVILGENEPLKRSCNYGLSEAIKKKRGGEGRTLRLE